MSDPVNVVFHSPSRHEVGPMVYLHWGAPSLIEDLKAALPRMRRHDVSYACARFIGYCHTQIDGMTSLGVSNILFPGIPEGATYGAVYPRIMAWLAEEIARVDVDNWVVEWDGQRIELASRPADRTDDSPGLGGVEAESEWLTCTDPIPMLGSLRGGAGDRKLRLFACACCRRIWHLIPDARSRRAVEVSEAFADGAVDRRVLAEAEAAANEVTESLQLAWAAAASRAARTRDFASLTEDQVGPYFSRRTYAEPGADLWDEVAEVAFGCRWAAGSARLDALNLEVGSEGYYAEFQSAKAEEGRFQADLLRDIFRASPTIDPAWLTPLVVDLAGSMYDRRSFDRMPALADALEEVGCTDAHLLDHCRSPTEHVRGCWVVDAVLRKV